MHKLLLVGVLAVIGSLLAAPSAMAQQSADLTCRASAVSVVVLGNDPIEPIVANADNDPCESQDRETLNETIAGILSLDALEARTSNNGDSAEAEARVTDVAIDLGGGTVITAEAINTSATARCRDGDTRLSGDSEIVDLRIDGTSVDADDETSIPIPLVGTLFLNRRIEDGNSITLRGVQFESAIDDALDITLAESRAGADNCPDDDDNGGGGGNNGGGGNSGGGNNGDNTDVAGPGSCADGIDNDGDGQIDFPADTDCDSPQDRERAECSDGIDNDGDGQIDFPADTNCDSPADDEEAGGPAGPVGTPRLEVPGSAGRAIADGRCVRRSFVARVRGNGVIGVSFRLDGRVIGRDNTAPYEVRVRSSRAGRHSVTAIVDLAGAQPDRTLRLGFARCGARPRFTG
jgi:DNA-binding protein YbaB